MVTVNIFLCSLQTVIIGTFILDVRLVKIACDCRFKLKKKSISNHFALIRIPFPTVSYSSLNLKSHERMKSLL